MSSVVAVSAGLAVAWHYNAQIDIIHAALTMAGVVMLHASVDILNDYWDYKRGIDKATQRTKMSGGTGVLPEGLLHPKQVYRAGMATLAAGAAIGTYFVIINGLIIAALLAFAVISIYFYSTRIVDSGLAEVFVAIKGACIVLGAYYIQADMILLPAILSGTVIGILSATVLFVTSFPDYEADRSRGRKTLVIVLGRERAARLFWMFPAMALGVIVISASTGVLPVYVLIALLATPLAVKAGLQLRAGHNDVKDLVPAMSNTIKFSRVAGVLLIVGLLIPY